jgi:4-amino-4-deoxychorismate lyase
MTTEFPIIAVNGHLGGAISPLDRGFTYGDGVFESCRVIHGRIPLWPYHRERLLASCRQLRIGCDPEQLDQYCEQLLVLPEVIQTPNTVLKVMVTRGVGGRGYRLPEASITTYCLAIFSGNPLLSDNYTQGVKLRICDYRLSANPVLAGLKHMNRLEQILARSEWDDEYHEGLLLDQQGNVIEATSSNLFVISAGELITPDLSHAGVAGVMRRLILENLAHAIGLVPRIKSLTLSELQKADELFICNSLAGIQPVLSVTVSPELLMSYVAGNVTRRLQSGLERALLNPSFLTSSLG